MEFLVKFVRILPSFFTTLRSKKLNLHIICILLRLLMTSKFKFLALAQIMKIYLTKYDNLFMTSFPYSMGWHGEWFLILIERKKSFGFQFRQRKSFLNLF